MIARDQHRAVLLACGVQEAFRRRHHEAGQPMVGIALKKLGYEPAQVDDFMAYIMREK
jgi:hypothetical protein